MREFWLNFLELFSEKNTSFLLNEENKEGWEGGVKEGREGGRKRGRMRHCVLTQLCRC